MSSGDAMSDSHTSPTAEELAKVTEDLANAHEIGQAAAEGQKALCQRIE